MGQSKPYGSYAPIVIFGTNEQTVSQMIGECLKTNFKTEHFQVAPSDSYDPKSIQIAVFLDSDIEPAVMQSALALLPKDCTIVLNLADLGLVRAFQKDMRRLKWMSARDPREFLGPLIDHYRGAYIRPNGTQLVDNQDDDYLVYSLAQPLMSDSALSACAMVTVCAQVGVAFHQIQSQLDLITHYPNRKVTQNENIHSSLNYTR